MAKKIVFYICNLDVRTAECKHRLIDGNQPISLCQAPSKARVIKGTADVVRTFDSECSYRGEFSVNINEPIAEPISTSEDNHEN